MCAAVVITKWKLLARASLCCLRWPLSAESTTATATVTATKAASTYAISSAQGVCGCVCGVRCSGRWRITATTLKQKGALTETCFYFSDDGEGGRLSERLPCVCCRLRLRGQKRLHCWRLSYVLLKESEEEGAGIHLKRDGGGCGGGGG